jgi:hypothetical protein
MSFATRVLLWRDFYDDEIVLFATADESDTDPDGVPRRLCVLGCLHLDSILDLFGFVAYNRIAKETRTEKLLPVELSLRFYNEDEA